MTIKELNEKISAENPRSFWDNGVKSYALEILGNGESNGLFSENTDFSTVELSDLLNHVDAENLGRWETCKAVSWGGNFEIYDPEIARRLCTPSELKKTRNGEKAPNSREQWLDVQTRAIFQAVNMIYRTAKA